jgi:hypothetical protein
MIKIFNYLRIINKNIFLFLSWIEKKLYLKEDIILNKSNTLKNKGFMLLEEGYPSLFPLKYESERDHSPYSNIRIVPKKDIEILISKLFIDNNLSHIIEEKLGMSFCVDFFAYYVTKHIPKGEEDDPFYANNWHHDSQFTSNSLKLFILPEDVTESHGPLSWITSVDSQDIIERSYLNGLSHNTLSHVKYMKFIGKKGSASFVRPNICLHKAGIPIYGLEREQIMIQLNPSSSFSIREDLYNRQFMSEPNMPIIKNLFRKKNILREANT